MKHGERVLHKVLNSYLILGFLRLPDLALFRGLEDAADSQKQQGRFHSMVPGFAVVFSANTFRTMYRVCVRSFWGEPLY